MEKIITGFWCCLSLIVLLIMCWVVLCLPEPADAGTLRLFSGALAGAGTHEAAHAITAEAFDTGTWHVAEDGCPLLLTIGNNVTDTQGAIIAGSGMAAQIVETELVLWTGVDSDFKRGMIAFNVAAPIVFAADYLLGADIINEVRAKGKHSGDFQMIEYYKGENDARLSAIITAAVCAWQGWRAWRRPAASARTSGVFITAGPGRAGLTWAGRF